MITYYGVYGTRLNQVHFGRAHAWGRHKKFSVTNRSFIVSVGSSNDVAKISDAQEANTGKVVASGRGAD